MARSSIARAALALLLLGVDVAPRAHASAADDDKGTFAFLYLWYGTPEGDGRWLHWDHAQLPHWQEAVRARYPPASVRYLPPDDIHAPFYPERGLYSSRDPATLRSQFRGMRELGGISVAICSWWGRADGSSKGDSQGVVTDALMPAVLDAASSAGVTVALHLEPYEGRDAESVARDLAYLADTYGAHPALARRSRLSVGGPPLPLLFVYDAYHIAPAQWARLLAPGGDLCVRGGAADGNFVGLWLAQGDGDDLVRGGFDGAYSYFATDGFSWGATSAHWLQMSAFCRARGLAFVPCVGPGYDDSRIRPWNVENRRDREGGAYYTRMWESALAAAPDAVAVTSYNEWGEGTQIEPSVPRRVDVDALAPLGRALNRTMRAAIGLSDAYSDYAPEAPGFYLELTRRFSARLRAQRRQTQGEQERVEEERVGAEL